MEKNSDCLDYNKGFIDLHTHSDVSDGSMTPGELVRHAKANGLCAVALTDHDEVAGLPEALEAGTKCGIEVIPGIELSVKSETETHILGYFIDYKYSKLLKTIEEARKVREERTVDSCRILTQNGMQISYEEVVRAADGGMTSRAHIAGVMVEKGYAESVKDAFKRYLSHGCPAYSSKQLLTAEEAIGIINEAGGRAYLAHPHLIGLTDDELNSFVCRLKKAGLSGIEGYYSEYTPEMQEKYQTLAIENGLTISGGTDFHAARKPHIAIGKGCGNMVIPYSVLEKMKSEAGLL